jgi:hypothetical protein
MKPSVQTTFAERIGRTLGRLWRVCVRLDQQATHWLVAKGWEPGVAKAVMLLVKLAAIGVLLFTALWSALAALAIMVVAAWTAHGIDDDDDSMSQTEWRYGPAGYGLYTSNEQRIDPHDPEDDQP